MHIPDDPGYYEKFYFTPGDLDFVTHRTSSAEIGVLICWDQWFPEAARLTALAGAQILFYPTAIGWTAEMPDKLRRKMYSAWETIQRAHAIANGVYVAAVNRVGVEGAIKFCWPTAIWTKSRRPAATGHFCAIAGSMLTATCCAVSGVECDLTDG
jgi:N-carbamoylputrescine amidase